MRDLAKDLESDLAVDSSLGVVELVADFPVTALGYSRVSPATMRPRKYRRVGTAPGLDPTVGSGVSRAASTCTDNGSLS
jgi:hypothetical protein